VLSAEDANGVADVGKGKSEHDRSESETRAAKKADEKIDQKEIDAEVDETEADDWKLDVKRVAKRAAKKRNGVKRAGEKPDDAKKRVEKGGVGFDLRDAKEGKAEKKEGGVLDAALNAALTAAADDVVTTGVSKSAIGGGGTKQGAATGWSESEAGAYTRPLFGST
jgi:hypothetical protein